MSAGLGIGLGLVVLSLVMIVPVLIVVWWRRLPRQESSIPATVSSFAPLDSSHTNEAILIVQAGGRVEYINGLAREWFGLHPDEPADLERLVRRARPAEELLNLFAHQGQKRLSVSGRLVEATSYQVPGPYPLMLVLMRSVELATNLSEVGTNSSILQIVSDFGKNVSASLDLEDTLYALLLNVSQLVPADVIEVKIADESKQTLTPYMLETSGTARVVTPEHSQFGGLTEVLKTRRQPLLIPDTRVEDLSLPELTSNSPVQSYLGLPLIAGEQFVGTLEVGNLSPGVLGQPDHDLLQLITAQSAYSIRNALLYASEQNRSAELGGLANLAQAFGPFRITRA